MKFVYLFVSLKSAVKNIKQGDFIVNSKKKKNNIVL